MSQLILLRHGKSQWNKENRFTGWVDVDLTRKGIEEAKSAGKLLNEQKFCIDSVYTSVLKRAIRTMWIVLDEMDLLWLPVVKSWRLNERHYGALQGLNKLEMVNKYGEVQVNTWRRSFDVAPPPMETDNPTYAGEDPKYKDLVPFEIPLTESLKDTLNRLLPFWNDTITKDLKQGKNVLIVAHGNSLRAIVKLLDDISEEDIALLNIPTGVPLVYDLEKNLKPIRHYYLGNEDEIKKAIDIVADQSRKK